jgi:predicted nucleic acid-binding protein
MKSPVTIDASVFISAFTPTEPAHEASRAAMAAIRSQAIPIIEPVLVLLEISAALSRGQNKPDLGRAFVNALKQFSNLTFVDVDASLADLAVDVAAQYKLRGSDAVYAAVALRFGTELITLDREQLEGLPKAIPVQKPGEQVQT